MPTLFFELSKECCKLSSSSVNKNGIFEKVINFSNISVIYEHKFEPLIKTILRITTIISFHAHLDTFFTYS